MEPPVGVPGDGGGEPRRQVELAGVAGPAPRRPQVVQPALDPVRPGRLVGAVQPRLGPLGEVDHEAGVPAPEPLGLAGGEPGGGVGAQGLQHPVAADAAGPRPRQHGPLGEPGHQVGDAAGGKVVAGRDRLRRRDVEAGREHRQAQEQPLLVGVRAARRTSRRRRGASGGGCRRRGGWCGAGRSGRRAGRRGRRRSGCRSGRRRARWPGGGRRGRGRCRRPGPGAAAAGRDPGVGRRAPGRGTAGPRGRPPPRRRPRGPPAAGRPGPARRRRRAARGWSPAPPGPGRGEQLLGEPGDGGQEVLAVVEDQEPAGPPRPLGERVRQAACPAATSIPAASATA